MWGPRRLAILWAFIACYRDCFTFYGQNYLLYQITISIYPVIYYCMTYKAVIMQSIMKFYLQLRSSKHVNVVVNCGFQFKKCLVLISAGTLSVLSEGFRRFPHFFQVILIAVPRLGQDHFLPDPFQFIIHR
jgi:hypothetical protein